MENIIKEKKVNVKGVIMSLLLIIFGVMMFIAPLKMIVGFQFIASIGIFIAGIFQIVRYFKHENKNGFALALGIMDIILGGWILYIWFFKSEFTALTVMTNFISMILFFLLLSEGINNFTYASLLKSKGEKSGFIIFGGVLNIILAIFILAMPFAATFAIEFFLSIAVGIYLIMAGVTLFAESMTYSKTRNI